MGLIGLRDVKVRAVSVAMKVLLKPPKHLDATIAMNFLFVGNPGCGKTTVANLLAKAMVELKYRTNPVPAVTSANDILADNDPPGAFSKLVDQASGECWGGYT